MIEEEKIEKIVQLDIEIDGLTEEELEEYGVEIVSLVDEPAIGVDFMAFADVDVELETYNDYPKAASRNAQRALDWAEENGWGSCGTPVGKRRANQLAKRQNISEETIARMSAFRRQEKNKNTPYGEGCGGLMWDAWGGDEGIAWAARKLEQIRREKDEYEKHNSGSYYSYNEEQEDAIIAYATDNGYELTADDVIINLDNKEFANVTETIEAIRGLDLLKRLNIEEMVPQTFWKYSGPPAERKFCKAMINLMKAGKIFSQKDIERMDGLNSQFARRNQSSYSIFKYKGGKNCKHMWKKLTVFENTQGQRVIIEGSPTNRTQDVATTRWANLSVDDDKRIVTGPLMIPNKMILRRNSEGEPYYIFFTRETIRKMAEKFFRTHKHNNTDIQHDNNITNDNTLIESWISEDKMYDKAYKMGFALPQGTWYVSYKIKDDETWDKVKKGELKGFSLAGPFIEKMANEGTQKQKLNSIIDILNSVDDETGIDSGERCECGGGNCVCS